MAGPFDWSVKIVPNPNGTGAVFQPNLPNSKPGDTLNAQTGDIVSWRNDTGNVHQPWPTQGNVPGGPPAPPPVAAANLLSNPIKPNESSNPQFVVNTATGTTIYYCCLNHPSEKGSITVVTL
jgi:plastocyanin